MTTGRSLTIYPNEHPKHQRPLSKPQASNSGGLARLQSSWAVDSLIWSGSRWGACDSAAPSELKGVREKEKERMHEGIRCHSHDTSHRLRRSPLDFESVSGCISSERRIIAHCGLGCAVN
jgi:hypothetical protein